MEKSIIVSCHDIVYPFTSNPGGCALRLHPPEHKGGGKTWPAPLFCTQGKSRCEPNSGSVRSNRSVPAVIHCFAVSSDSLAFAGSCGYRRFLPEVAPQVNWAITQSLRQGRGGPRPRSSDRQSALRFFRPPPERREGFPFGVDWVEGVAFEQFTVFHDINDGVGVVNVVEGILVKDHQIGQFAGFNGAEILRVAHGFGTPNRGGTKHIHVGGAS